MTKSESIATRYYHHENAKFASLGAPKVIRGDGTFRGLSFPRASDEVSMENVTVTISVGKTCISVPIDD